MNKVRVLVLTSFTYIYGSKMSYRRCGDSFELNPSSPNELEELKYILASSYLKNGLIYIEDEVIFDYINKEGYFAITEKVVENSTSVKEEVAVIEKDTEIVVTLEDRKAELNDLPAAEVRKIAESLEISYSNKSKAIEDILNLEYSL